MLRIYGSAAQIWVALVLPVSLNAQEAVFRSETTLMEVEVRVTDRRGGAIDDLTAANFELRENGRLQPIASVEYIGGEIPSRAESPAADQGRASTEVAREQLRRSSFVYIATRGRREDVPNIYRAVKTFIEDNVRPGVFVSLDGTPFSSKQSILLEELRGRWEDRTGRPFFDTLVTDLARDVEYSPAFEALVDAANEEFEGEAESLFDSQAFYNDLRILDYIDLIRALSIYPGKKMLVLFTPGMALSTDQNLDLMKVLETEATRARVSFYVSDVGRLTAIPPGGDAEAAGNVESLMGDPFNNGFNTQQQARQDAQDGLVELAKRTGGRALINSNELGEVFKFVMEASRGYYLLGYYPEDVEERGRFRKIRVDVNRKGLKVNHQRGYFEQRPFERMSEAERNLALREALLFDTPFADLPLQVDHEFFRDSKGAYRLVYSAGLHSRDLPAERVSKGREVNLTVVAQAVLVDSGGPRRPHLDDRRFRMVIPGADYERLSADPHSLLHYGSQMSLDPGVYDWKVIVRDEHSGAVGSYATQIRIPDASSELGASSLLLTGRIEESVTRNEKRKDADPEDVLQVAGTRFYATAAKIFRKGDPLYLLYDIYNPAAEHFEAVPGPRIALYRGSRSISPPPFSNHQTVPDEPSKRLRYLARLETDELPNGDYTVVAMLPSTDGKRRLIHRQFQIVGVTP